MARSEPEAVRITSATRSHTDDLGARKRRYLISMGIRTVCFVLAAVSIGHWFMWFFIFGAIFLPYVAVVLANVGITADPADLDPVQADPSLHALEGPSGQGT